MTTIVKGDLLLPLTTTGEKPISKSIANKDIVKLFTVPDAEYNYAIYKDPDTNDYSILELDISTNVTDVTKNVSTNVYQAKSGAIIDDVFPTVYTKSCIVVEKWMGENDMYNYSAQLLTINSDYHLELVANNYYVIAPEANITSYIAYEHEITEGSTTSYKYYFVYVMTQYSPTTVREIHFQLMEKNGTNSVCPSGGLDIVGHDTNGVYVTNMHLPAPPYAYLLRHVTPDDTEQSAANDVIGIDISSCIIRQNNTHRMGICKIDNVTYALCAMTVSGTPKFYLLQGKTISLLTTNMNESGFVLNISQYVDYIPAQSLSRLYCLGVRYGSEETDKSNTVYITLNVVSAMLYAIQSTDGTTQSYYIDDIDSFSLSSYEKIFLVRDTTSGDNNDLIQTMNNNRVFKEGRTISSTNPNTNTKINQKISSAFKLTDGEMRFNVTDNCFSFSADSAFAIQSDQTVTISELYNYLINVQHSISAISRRIANLNHVSGTDPEVENDAAWITYNARLNTTQPTPPTNQ